MIFLSARKFRSHIISSSISFHVYETFCSLTRRSHILLLILVAQKTAISKTLSARNLALALKLIAMRRQEWGLRKFIGGI